MKLTESKNIKLGIILSYCGLIVSILGSLFISNRVLNYIGDYNYGLYSFVNSITSWITVVSSALTASFLRFTSIEAKDNDGNVARTNTLYLKLLSFLGAAILLLGLIIIGYLYICGIHLGSYSWEDSKLMYLLFAFSVINIAITMPTNVWSLYISYRKQFVFQKTISIIITLLNFAGHFFIAYFTRNILLISVYSILITIITFLFNYCFSKKELGIDFQPIKISENGRLVKSIIFFSSILLFNSIVDQINSDVDKTLLGIFSVPQDITLYQMGQYFPYYVGTMAVAISGVFAPSINSMVVNEKREEVNSLFFNVSRLQAIVVCCITFGFISCGKDFVIWWLGEQRITSYYIASILMLLNIMPLSVKTSIDIQRAMNKHKFRSGMFFFVALLNVLISIALLKVMPKKYAVYACVLGTVMASVLTQWIAMNIYNCKVIKLPMKAFLKRLIMCILYGVVGYAVVYFERTLILSSVESTLIKFIIEGLTFIAVYGVFILIFERKFLVKYLKKK